MRSIGRKRRDTRRALTQSARSASAGARRATRRPAYPTIASRGAPRDLSTHASSSSTVIGTQKRWSALDSMRRGSRRLARLVVERVSGEDVGVECDHPRFLGRARAA